MAVASVGATGGSWGPQGSSCVSVWQDRPRLRSRCGMSAKCCCCTWGGAGNVWGMPCSMHCISPATQFEFSWAAVEPVKGLCATCLSMQVRMGMTISTCVLIFLLFCPSILPFPLQPFRMGACITNMQMQPAAHTSCVLHNCQLASSVSLPPALYVLCILQAAQEAEGSGTSSSEDELADAQVAVAEATSSGRIKDSSGSVLASLFEVASLIFLAEWGDRSMLATIALGAAQVRAGVDIKLWVA